MAKTTSCNLILFIVYFLLRFFVHQVFDNVCGKKLTKFSSENTLQKVNLWARIFAKIVVFHFYGKLGTFVCIEIHATSISCFVDKKVEKSFLIRKAATIVLVTNAKYDVKLVFCLCVDFCGLAELH